MAICQYYRAEDEAVVVAVVVTAPAAITDKDFLMFASTASEFSGEVGVVVAVALSIES